MFNIVPSHKYLSFAITLFASVVWLLGCQLTSDKVSSQADDDGLSQTSTMTTSVVADEVLELMRRGQSYADTGDYDRAILNYGLAIELAPDYVQAYIQRGRAYTGDIYRARRAIKDFSKAIELAPDLAIAYYHRGVRHFVTENYDQAVDDLSQAIDLDPTYTDAYRWRAMSFQKLGNQEQATADWERLLSITPQSAEGYLLRGSVHLEFNKDIEKAIEDYTKAIELEPDWALAYYKRGYLYLSRGDKEKALIDFEQYLDIEPDTPFRRGVERRMEQLRVQ